MYRESLEAENVATRFSEWTCEGSPKLLIKVGAYGTCPLSKGCI